MECKLCGKKMIQYQIPGMDKAPLACPVCNPGTAEALLNMVALGQGENVDRISERSNGRKKKRS